MCGKVLFLKLNMDLDFFTIFCCYNDFIFICGDLSLIHSTFFIVSKYNRSDIE